MAVFYLLTRRDRLSMPLKSGSTSVSWPQSKLSHLSHLLISLLDIHVDAIFDFPIRYWPEQKDIYSGVQCAYSQYMLCTSFSPLDG